MEVLDLLKGRKVKYMTDAQVEVILEIESVYENKHSKDLEPATSANDWWPASKEWTTFDVTFTNGFKSSYNGISSIKILE